MRAAILLVAALLVPLACVTEEVESDDDSQQQPVDECARGCEVVGDCTPSPECAYPCQATAVSHCENSEACARHGMCCLLQDQYACGYCGDCG